MTGAMAGFGVGIYWLVEMVDAKAIDRVWRGGVGDQLPALEDAVASVIERIATNPHAVGVEIEQDRVRYFVDRRYLGGQTSRSKAASPAAPAVVPPPMGSSP